MKAQYNVIRLMIKQSNINNHVKNLFYNSFIKMQNKNCVNVCICHKLFLLKFYTVSSQKLLCCGMPMQLPAVHIVGKDNGTTNTWSHKKHICQRHLDIILMYRVLSRVLAFLGFFSASFFLQQYTHGYGNTGSGVFKRGVQKRCQKLPKFDFQSQFSMSKIIRNFLNFFFIEGYQFRGTFFVVDIF